MGHLYYFRHFGVLAAATVILFLLGHWSLLKDALIVSFAINGALHASALVLTLRAPESLRRKASFVAIAVALSVLTLYVGIIGLVLFAVLPATERLYVVLGVCALSGAITYGSLIRLFWMRNLSSRLILAMSVLCLLATSLAFFARTYTELLGSWWLAAAWWFAFSGGLWYFDTRREAPKLQKRNPARAIQ
ncbi:MAG: hypothetical protein M3N91_06625 [Pseudomonadota bacterium]|nr:hypothetical protein [Pseudomonadota bacterium]